MWSDSDSDDEEFDDIFDEEPRMYPGGSPLWPTPPLRRPRPISPPDIGVDWNLDDFVSMSSAEEALQCLVCLEQNVLQRDCRPCCNQPVCRTCLERCVSSKLQCGVVHISCPLPDCDGRVHVQELSRLKPELARLYYRRLVGVNMEPHRKTCPNCCLVTEPEQSRLTDVNKSAGRGLVISCAECQFQWCFQCHGPQHPRRSCNENRAADRLVQIWAQREGRQAPRAQQCPVCKVTP